jgi:hypothetical protein
VKHRWRFKGSKGDAVWKHMTWRCARCGVRTSLTAGSGEAHEAKHRPKGARTYGAPPSCEEAIVAQVHDL